MNVDAAPSQPTRSEVAEYLHELAGQLAEMAREAGMAAAAEALVEAQKTIESEF